MVDLDVVATHCKASRKGHYITFPMRLRSRLGSDFIIASSAHSHVFRASTSDAAPLIGRIQAHALNAALVPIEFLASAMCLQVSFTFRESSLRLGVQNYEYAGIP